MSSICLFYLLLNFKGLLGKQDSFKRFYSQCTKRRFPAERPGVAAGGRSVVGLPGVSPAGASGGWRSLLAPAVWAPGATEAVNVEGKQRPHVSLFKLVGLDAFPRVRSGALVGGSGGSSGAPWKVLGDTH